MFTISSNAFLTQELSNLAGDDVSPLRLFLPLFSFVVGWLVGFQEHQFPGDEKRDGSGNFGFFTV
jgi:hypothetical protein